MHNLSLYKWLSKMMSSSFHIHVKAMYAVLLKQSQKYVLWTIDLHTLRTAWASEHNIQQAKYILSMEHDAIFFWTWLEIRNGDKSCKTIVCAFLSLYTCIDVENLLRNTAPRTHWKKKRDFPAENLAGAWLLSVQSQFISSFCVCSKLSKK